MAVVDDAHGSLGTLTQFFQCLLNFLGRLLSTVRELAHFVGDDGKATALFTGAGGFDGSIQCQQVGLLGNGLN